MGRDTQDCRSIGPSFAITSGITSVIHNATQSYWPSYMVKHSGRNQWKSSSCGKSSCFAVSTPEVTRGRAYPCSYNNYRARLQPALRFLPPTSLEQLLQRAMSIKADLYHNNCARGRDDSAEDSLDRVVGSKQCQSASSTKEVRRKNNQAPRCHFYQGREFHQTTRSQPEGKQRRKDWRRKKNQ